MSLPLAQAGVARVIDQVEPADRRAEPAPEPLVEGGDGDVAVLGAEGAHGHHRGVHRTGWLRWLAGGLGQGDVVAEEAEEAVEHADVQHLPAPGAFPLVQSGGDGLDSVEPGHHIADREARAQRRPAAGYTIN